MKNNNDIFILQKNIGKYKKGKKFSSFGGIVSGVDIDGALKPTLIRFDDSKYFKLQKQKP